MLLGVFINNWTTFFINVLTCDELQRASNALFYECCIFSIERKNPNTRLMAGTIIGETKRGSQRKAKRHIAHRNPKKGKS
jgi:hypothetical protein